MNMILINEFYRDNNLFELVNEQDNKPMFISPDTMAKLHGLPLGDDLSEEICHWLTQKFPNISSLHVVIAGFDKKPLKPLILLFTAWATRLSTLKLCLPDNSDLSDYFSLFEQIDIRLLELKNLTLCIVTYFNEPDQPIYSKTYQLDLPFLSRLNRFYFYTLDDPDIILDSLVRYGQPNQNLDQISLRRNLFIQDSAFRKFRALNPDLTRHLTDLLQSALFSDLSLVELQTLFRQFPNQQSRITIDNSQMSYSVADLIESLSLLKHLISFYFVITNTIPDCLHLTFNLPQLNSIKILSLDGVYSHTLLSQLNIAWIFPNIQILVLCERGILCYGTHSHSVVEGHFDMCAMCNGNEQQEFRVCIRFFVRAIEAMHQVT